MVSARIFNGAKGFTLMEMLVVVAIIGILAAFVMPSSSGKIIKIYISEDLQLVEPYTQVIANYYSLNGTFPSDNKEAGIPEPELITGNYLDSVELKDGALHLVLGQKIGDQWKGKIVTLRPVYVPKSPGSPISWICGYDDIPEKMKSPAENKTDVERTDLPLKCL